MTLVSAGLGLTGSDYSYVLATFVGAAVLNQAHGIAVTGARKRAGIKYPNAYATDEQVKADKSPEQHVVKFNCAQRAHQNYLENFTQHITVTAIAGLSFPRAAAALSTVWLVGRALFLYGYLSGDPSKRMIGAIQYIGTFGLLGLSIYTVYEFVAASL